MAREHRQAGGAFGEFAFQRAPRFCKTDEQQLNKDIWFFKPDPFKFGRLFLKIQTFLFQNTLGASGFGSESAAFVCYTLNGDSGQVLALYV